MSIVFPADHDGPLVLPIKDPSAVISYEVDWSGQLATGELISTSVWTLSAGITKESDGITAGQLEVTIVLSGGTTGTTYLLTNHITTNQGLEFERSYRQLVRNL